MRSVIGTLAWVMAVLGGIVLTLLIAITCISVLGRGLNTLGNSDALVSLAPGFAAWLIGTGVGPVPGDFEVVQAGMAFAIFAFLPICQYRGAHATVDVFTDLMPQSGNLWLRAFWEVLMALAIILIGWRLYVGLLEKVDNGQTTMLLQFPIWWAYAASFVAALVAGLVGIYCAIGRVAERLGGRDWLPEGEGGEH